MKKAGTDTKRRVFGADSYLERTKKQKDENDGMKKGAASL